MSNIFDKIQSIVSSLTTIGTTNTGSTQSAADGETSYNEVSVFTNQSDLSASSSTKMKDEEYFWWEKRLEEKKQEKEKTFDESMLDSKEWENINAKTNKNIFGNVKDYTFTTSGGTKIDLEDINGVKIYENKTTGEVIIVGANGATINAGNKDAKITIYDSDIKKLDTDKGNDEVKIYNSNVDKITTGRGIDNVIIKDSTVQKINTGAGTDNVFVTDSNVGKLKTASGEDNVSLNNTEVNKLKINKKDTVVEDSNYLDIDKTKIAELGADAVIDIGDGTTTTVSEYSQYLLSQPVGFETEEEYQEYVLQALTSNLETMKKVYGEQTEKNGWIAKGYDGLKELTGLGISEKDALSMIENQEAMIEGLTAALKGESNMSFEEAYEFYTGTSYSKEKIDKYMEVANIYSAIMVGCQYDDNYIKEFETATGKSVEDVTKEYAMCQLDTFGKSTGIQDLVEKYAQDQENFADKLSGAITTVGMTCLVVGAVVSFVFPPAAPVGAALMTAGKYVSLGGMFVDNAIDLVNDSTDADGLTKEELSQNALETGVEVVSYAAGRAIGKFTNGLNSVVSNAASEYGAGNITSYIAGQAAETSADMLLSLGADYAIAQGQSLITTGEFMDSEEYWSLDRFLGEGKNQLIGILTGLSSSKINNYQQGIIASAGAKISSGDLEGAKNLMLSSGMKMTDTDFDSFVKTIQQVEVKAIEAPKTEDIVEDDIPKLKAPNENDTQVEVNKPKEDVDSTSTEQTGRTQTIPLTKEEKIQQLKDNGISDLEIKDIIELGDIEYQRVTELINKYYLGMDGSIQLAKIASLDADMYSKIPELIASNCHPDCLAKIASLYDPTYPDDYEMAVKLLNNGYDSHAIAGYIDDYGFLDISKLNNSDLVQKPRNLNIDYSNMSPKTKQRLVDNINKLYGSTVVSIDDDISTIAYKWKSKYIDGGAYPLSFDNQTTNFLIENSCKQYENPNSEPMARWMEIPNLSYFIEHFPANGEIYTFDRMQSFAKTERGAEIIKGNNFSNTNTSKNVKILVTPNGKTTQAYDIGEGKYGSDEILYKAGTKFKVISQGIEEIRLESGEINKQYVVYLEEIPQTNTKLDNELGEEVTDGLASRIGIQFFAEKTKQTDENIDPAKKYSDSEILDPNVNQQLSSNAVKLNETFEKNIKEVTQSTKNRFSGLKTVNANNITGRAKSAKSTFEKIASKFKSGKLSSMSIEDCNNAIGDAYGTRVQMNNIDADIAKSTITEALDGTGITYEQFVDYVTGKATFDDATTQKLAEIKAPIFDILKTKQSQETVDRLVHIINNANPDDPPVITELNNYGGTISSYFTDAQLEQIATAYSNKYGKPLDIVTKLDERNLPSGEFAVEKKDGKTILNVQSAKAKYTDKGAKKDSGYATSQMNTKHMLSDGTFGNGEIQIRGVKVSAFADVEHIPYDIRKGKIKPDDPKYASVYNLIKGMDDATYKQYNEYLTAVYETLRLQELGIPIDGEPQIGTYLKNSGLSTSDLELLSRSGLEKLH